MDGGAELRPEDGAKQAANLMEAVLQAITKQSQDPQGAIMTDGRLFFPSGIEAISLQFKIGDSVDIHFRILGKDAPGDGENSMVWTGADEPPGDDLSQPSS